MDCDFTRISDDWDVDVANGPLEDGRKSKGRQKRDEMLQNINVGEFTLWGPAWPVVENSLNKLSKSGFLVVTPHTPPPMNLLNPNVKRLICG